MTHRLECWVYLDRYPSYAVELLIAINKPKPWIERPLVIRMGLWRCRLYIALLRKTEVGA